MTRIEAGFEDTIYCPKTKRRKQIFRCEKCDFCTSCGVNDKNLAYYVECIYKKDIK